MKLTQAPDLRGSIVEAVTCAFFLVVPSLTSSQLERALLINKQIGDLDSASPEAIAYLLRSLSMLVAAPEAVSLRAAIASLSVSLPCLWDADRILASQIDLAVADLYTLAEIAAALKIVDVNQSLSSIALALRSGFFSTAGAMAASQSKPAPLIVGGDRNN